MPSILPRALCLSLATLLTAAACSRRQAPPPAPVESGARLLAPTNFFDPTTTFEVRFDLPVASPDAVGRISDESPLRIAPPVEGLWTWLSTRSGVFTPSEPLAMGTRYRFTLGKITDAAGKPVAAKLDRTVATPGLRLLGPTPAVSPFSTVSAEPGIRLHFSAPVDPASAAPFLEFRSAGGQSTPATAAWATNHYSLFYYYQNNPELAPWRARFAGAARADEESDGPVRIPNALLVSPRTPLAAGDAWRLVVKKGLPAGPGPDAAARIEEEAVSELGRVEHLKVAHVSADNAAGSGRRLTIQFNKAVSPRLADPVKKLLLEPAVAGMELTTHPWQWTASGAFDLDRDYRVRIAGGLEASDGTTLHEPFSATVRFARVPGRLYLPEITTHARAGSSEAIDLLSVNVPEARLRAVRLNPAGLVQALLAFGNYNRPWNSTNSALEPYQRIDTTPLAGAPAVDRVLKLGGALDEARTTPLAINELLGGRSTGPVLLQIEGAADGAQVGVQGLFQITQLGALWKRAPNGTLAYVFSMADGAPVKGATIKAFAENGGLLFPAGAARTGDGGIAFLKDAPDPRWLQIEQGDDVHAINAADDSHGLWAWRFDIPTDFSTSSSPAPSLLATAFSERPVYQPGEMLHLKLVARESSPTGLKLPAPREIPVNLFDARGRLFLETNAMLTAQGAATLSVRLPRDGLGQYRAEFSVDGQTFPHFFSVQQYQPDAFEIKIAAPSAFAAGDPVNLPMTARYYFGKPLAKATVRWSASGEDIPFSVDGLEGFNFSPVLPSEALNRTGGSFSDRGEIVLGEGGAAAFAPAIPLNTNAPGPRAARVLVEITDLNQQTVSQSAEFTRHSSDFYIGLRETSGVQPPGARLPLQIVAFTPDGKPHAPPVHATARLTRILWKTTETEGAGRTRLLDSKPELRLLAETNLAATAASRAGAKWIVPEPGPNAPAFTPPEPGEYLLEVESTDAAGRRVAAAEWFSVYGGGEADTDVRDGVRLDLIPDKEEYFPGDTAMLLVKSPVKGRALVSLEREGVRRAFPFDVTGPGSVIKIPLDAGDAPNIFVNVTMVRGAKDGAGPHPSPEFRYGWAQINVAEPAKRLAVSVAPAAPDSLPGGDVTVTATIRDHAGKPVAGADLALFAVDEGVLALMGYETPDLAAFFNAARPLRVRTAISLRQLFPADPARRNFFNKGYVIGDGGDYGEALRKNFEACAYWNGALATGPDGIARATFKAPDSLTRYRVVAVAAAGADRFGSAESAFEVRKPVMIQPALPLCARTGDRLAARGVVHNLTADPRRVEVALALDDKAAAENGAPGPVTITVPARGTSSVDFPLRIAGTGTAAWTWSARTLDGEPYRDSVLSTLSVNEIAPLLREIHVGRFSGAQTNLLAAANPRLLEGQGRVEAAVANTRLGDIAEAAAHLLKYPYGCVEQTTSSLLPWIALRDAAARMPVPGLDPSRADDAIRRGIDRLLGMQTPSGGLAYWPGGGEPMLWGSAYGGMALALAQRAGAGLPSGDMERLGAWIRGQLENTATIAHPHELSVRCLAVYALALLGQAEPSYHELLYARRGVLSSESRAILAMAIAEASGPREMIATLLDPGQSAEPAGAFWFGCPAREIAIDLMARCRANPSDPLVDRRAEELTALRRNGAWTTTQGNAWALLALAEYARTVEAARKPAPGAFAWKGGRSDFKLDESGGIASVELPLPWTESAGPLTVENPGGATLFTRVACEARPPGAAPREDRGFAVTRGYRRIEDDGKLTQTDKFRVGDRVLVTLRVDSRLPGAFVAIDDPLPGLFEAVNPEFKSRETAGTGARAGASLHFDHTELRADRALFFRDFLRRGAHEWSYVARVRAAGTALAPGARVEEMYNPDRYGASEPATITAEPLP